MLTGLLGPQAPPALVVLLLLDLLHVGLARFQLVEPGSDSFRCSRGCGIRDLLEAPDVEPAGLYAGEGLLMGLLPLFIANASLQVARDAGRRILRRLLSLCRGHSTPWRSGSSAASFAHSSAISFPSMPDWAGHHRTSTGHLILSRALRACRAYCWEFA